MEITQPCTFESAAEKKSTIRRTEVVANVTTRLQLWQSALPTETRDKRSCKAHTPTTVWARRFSINSIINIKTNNNNNKTINILCEIVLVEKDTANRMSLVLKFYQLRRRNYYYFGVIFCVVCVLNRRLCPLCPVLSLLLTTFRHMGCVF